jgi:hypothetical protein
MQHTSPALQARQECVPCSAQTYSYTCGTCGSMNLQPVTPSSEDIRRVGDLPLSMKALLVWEPQLT